MRVRLNGDVIEFPSSMSKRQVTAALKKLHAVDNPDNSLTKQDAKEIVSSFQSLADKELVMPAEFAPMIKSFLSEVAIMTRTPEIEINAPPPRIKGFTIAQDAMGNPSAVTLVYED